MDKGGKTLTLTLVIGFLALTLLTGPAFARNFFNGEGDIYCFIPGCEDAGTSGQTKVVFIQSSHMNLETLIIKRAGHFLVSFSNAMMFSNKHEVFETDGVQYSDLADSFYKTLANLEIALEYSYLFEEQAETKSLNPKMVTKLQSFDYIAFAAKKQLNPIVFSKVVLFLKNGDLAGLNRETSNMFEELHKMLYTLKTSIDNGQFPENESVWRISQKYSEILLFGQYCAEVFSEINN